MQVILLKDVPKIGRAHEVKNVNDGYAMNFLFPKKLAEIATAEKIKRLEEKKKSAHIEKSIREDLLDKNLSDLSDKEVLISSKANEKGHLFSAIRDEEIVKALLDQHRISIDVDSIEIEKPIKELGEHNVKVSIGKKSAVFKVIVSSDNS